MTDLDDLRLKAGDALFLDFDGTLAELGPDPDAIRLPEAKIAALDPELVVCLGDSFDDMDASGALSGRDHARLGAIASGRDWLWIAGNHDPLPLTLPGAHQTELRLGPLTFRHAAETDTAPGEVSGHYHPKLRLAAKGRAITRACFLHDSRRLILPAFGAYTGAISRQLKDALND
ncbi:hypothetical protein CNY89_08640 [Amaricoccus sp. HAR-UPW-R2A-40]|nr:hypothetical protein CNY89_08640 [Amaricoccus sp. HAR-UPW-R2A-40]